MEIVGFLAALLIVWVGHAALWLFALNVLYSRPIHRKRLKLMRLAFGVVIWGFPLVVLAFKLDYILAESRYEDGWGAIIYAYVSLCAITCLFVIPFVTFLRRMQPPPWHLVEKRSEILDTVRELGSKPAGDGKHRRVALLPGNQVFQVEFNELTLVMPDLPKAWDGLTILQLSDWHLTGTPSRDFYELVLDHCMKAGPPDVLAVTGDLIDTDRHHRWLVPLLGRLKWNEAALAILGNHDYWHRPERVRRRLAHAGLTVLGNGWRELRVRGEPLIAIGHEGPWFRPGPDLRDCPATGFRLCLSHTPDHIRWARKNRIRLMLSGHTHGGQIRLPLFGSLFVPSRYSRRYDCGLFWAEPTLMYVSRGLGAKEPIRYNCRPEVTRFILRRLDDGALSSGS